MNDGIIKETKNSRLIKSNLPSTYDQLRTMAATDGLPVDLLLNLAGWQQIPSFLNKASLMPDTLVTLLSLDGLAEPLVKDALLAITIGAGKYAFKFTVTYSNGLPAAGLTIGGVLSLNGSPCVTNSQGIAIGVTTTQQATATIDLSNCVDVRTVTTKSLAGVSGAVVEVAMTITLQSTLVYNVLSSGSIRFSSAVDTVDFSAVGGGGGGGGGSPTGGAGNGGGGGYVSNALAKTIVPFQEYVVTIGAAGVGGAGKANTSSKNPGTAGGTTSVAGIVSATGGAGAIYGTTAATGNGNGGYNSGSSNVKATNGTQSVFGDGSIAAGGGGGIGYTYGSSNNAPGYPCGGDGGRYIDNYSNAGNGSNGSNPGGGGGGGGGGAAMQSGTFGGNGGNGAPGSVYVRWRYRQHELLNCRKQ